MKHTIKTIGELGIAMRELNVVITAYVTTGEQKEFGFVVRNDRAHTIGKSQNRDCETAINEAMAQAKASKGVR